MSIIQTDTPPLPPARPELVGMSAERLARIRPALEREMEAGRFPGGVVAIARRGKLVHLEAVGWLDPVAKVPMRAIWLIP